MGRDGSAVADGRFAAAGTTGIEAAPSVSVVVPALNESRNLSHVLTRMPGDVHEVILVDGRSTDGTADLAKLLYPGIRIVRQVRRGKGNALACGFAAATGDIIVTIDADGSTDPGEIPRFVDALLAGWDFAKGSRFIVGGGSSDITRFRRYGNRWLNRLSNVLHRTDYTDLCYGFNAFWRYCLPSLDLEWSEAASEDEPMRWGDGFEIETLMHIRVARAGYRVAEVPSFESARLHGRSNLNAPLDGLRVLRTIAVELRADRARGRLGDRDVVIDLTGDSVSCISERRGRSLPPPEPAVELVRTK
jgi:glycosyltransferase involved in cell wall biosynthesis